MGKAARGSGQRRQFVVLYRIGQTGNTAVLNVERKIPAQDPAFPAFRPRAPGRFLE